MSEQFGFAVLPAQLQRMKGLLSFLGRSDDFAIWFAHVELFERKLIAHDVMQYGLEKIYPLLTDSQIRDLHREIMTGRAIFTGRVSDKEDYKRLTSFIDIVFWRPGPVDQMTDLVFDSMLDTQMFLVQQVQSERRGRALGGA